MKTSFRIIAASVAACMALVSCNKESLTENVKEEPTGEPRTISVSFAKNTRTTLDTDGVTPLFSNGDAIKVSNDQTTEIVNVSGSGTSASITTTLTGDLTMFYPAAASDDGVSFTVSSTQSGKFADANICKATVSEGSTKATFENVVAVLRFYVDASIGVKSIKVESDNDNIATGSQAITVDPDGDATLNTVTDDPKKRVCYVAALPGTSTSTLTFTSVTTTQTKYENNTVTREVSGAQLAVNTLYNAFIPYYIEVDLGEGNIQKWGYCNVGAFFPEEYGEYFAWGETTGHYPSATAATGKEFQAAFTGNDKGFAWDNCLFTNGVYSSSNKNVFTKYTGSKNEYAKSGTADGKTTLDSSDDAATQNWGEAWRMPTNQELSDLLDKTSTSTSNLSNGILTINGHPSLIFPAAGYGKGAKLSVAGSIGCYWSSSLDTVTPSYAYYLGFYSSSVITYNYYRYHGLSVRPVSVSN